ncbi:D-aminoacylase [Hyphococcus flavus]|uniref:D-aminoacylase n=1 Tax=Hyphococcus flavus TaxID=1866326 RepID=A0AAE9ZD92_9PROT|nr:D-aminoacylase [Hyphococcus flavus]WDI30362.1 D-aminoacylase [Hyphococcus flavus]
MLKKLAAAAFAALAGCSGGSENAGERYDVIIRGGTVYDGSGSPGMAADVAIEGDRIVAVGDLGDANADTVIDAEGRAVTPGFINMLSWAVVDLIHDGRSLGDISQGVTLEVFGEGVSWGPLSEEMKDGFKERQSDIQYDIPWTTLGEYLEHLETKGVSPNVASFVGATTVRMHEVGYENRAATPEELASMQELVRDAMREGAMGVGSSLIYAPANFASTEELVALNEAAAEFGGMYISHIRNESHQLLEAVDELIQIAREAGIPAEIYHLKASGQSNWNKLDEVVAKVEAAQAEGLRITADMYTYPASSTGLDAAMPLWVQEGGYEAWAERLQDSDVRARVAEAIENPSAEFVSGITNAGGPEGVLLVGFKNPELRKYIGKTLAEVADERGKPYTETAMDLVIEDGSRVQVVYFSMSEENIAKKVALPWVSFGSDGGSMAPEGLFLEQSTHPRAYGNFARVYAKYIRDEGVITLEEAVRKMTSLPAGNLKIKDRGMLAPGYYADVVVFDPEAIQDKATFAEPHQLAVGVDHVFVNGVHTLRDGEHTGAFGGRVVRGPGWEGRESASE